MIQFEKVTFRETVLDSNQRLCKDKYIPVPIFNDEVHSIYNILSNYMKETIIFWHFWSHVTYINIYLNETYFICWTILQLINPLLQNQIYPLIHFICALYKRANCCLWHCLGRLILYILWAFTHYFNIFCQIFVFTKSSSVTTLNLDWIRK